MVFLLTVVAAGWAEVGPAEMTGAAASEGAVAAQILVLADGLELEI